MGKDQKSNAGVNAVAEGDEDLPEVVSLSQPVKIGPNKWVAFRLVTRGRRVIDEETICEPGPYAVVLERIRIDMIRSLVSIATRA